MTVKVIRAPAGLGKTSQLVEMLGNTTYGKIEIYVPTHDLGNHVSSLLRGSMHFVAIKGRSQLSDLGDPMCAKHREAQILASKGYPVYPVLCVRRTAAGSTEHCEHHSTCPYIAQFDGPEQVYIYTHASLPLERGALEEGIPGLAVIDESFFKSCIEVSTLGVQELLSPAAGPYTRAICDFVVQALRDGKPVLTAIRDRSLDGTLAAALEESKPAIPVVSPYWLPDKQAKAVRSLPPRPRTPELLETLRAELGSGRTASHSLVFDNVANAVRLHRRLPISRFASNDRSSDVLILDADADPLVIRQWFPGAVFETIAARRNAHVSQCVSTRCSTTSLVPERNSDPDSRKAAEKRLEDLQVLINRKAAGGKRVLVVGPQAITGNPAKEVSPLIIAPPGTELAHFGAIRGADRWKDFEVVIVVGRNQPPIDAVEGIARAVWYDDRLPLIFALDWEVEQRGYRVRGDTPATGVEVIVHPDLRVQAVLEQLREKESTQAIDRLRLVHAAQPKEVIVLSNIPLDVDVDVLGNWEEITLGTRLKRAWGRLQGVVPLAPAWLAGRFPDLWPSADAAEADLRNPAKYRDFANEISLSPGTVYSFHYRAHGQKRHSRAISVLPVAATQSELVRLMGNQPLVIAQVNDGVRGGDHSFAVGNATFEPLSGKGEA